MRARVHDLQPKRESICEVGGEYLLPSPGVGPNAVPSTACVRTLMHKYIVDMVTVHVKTRCR